MTPNERQVLDEFIRLREASATTISQQVAVSLNYANQLCRQLLDAGYLEEISKGKLPAAYRIKGREENIPQQFHSFWVKLIKNRKNRDTSHFS